MDYKRFILAAFGAWIVDALYGTVRWMTMFADEYAKYPAVFRPEGSPAANVPMALAGALAAVFALTYLYARNYRAGHGVMEGIRFGIVIGTFVVGCVSLAIYKSINVDSHLAVVASVGSFVEIVLIGAVIGALYRPYFFVAVTNSRSFSTN